MAAQPVKEGDAPPSSIGSPSGTGQPLPRRPPLKRGHVLGIGLALAIGAVLAVTSAAWWATVPFLAVVGSAFGVLVGRRFYDLAAPVVGFVVALVFWGTQLLLLPPAPMGRLAVILGQVEGVSAPVIEVLTLVLFGLVVALLAATMMGLLRFINEWRSSVTAA